MISPNKKIKKYPAGVSNTCFSLNGNKIIIFFLFFNINSFKMKIITHNFLFKKKKKSTDNKVIRLKYVFI